MTLIPLIRWHHERLDGRGYPDGLAGDAIPLLARLLAVADVYDAAASDRPYRSAVPHEKTLHIMRQNAAAGGLDAELVEEFAALPGRRPCRRLARLVRDASEKRFCEKRFSEAPRTIAPARRPQSTRSRQPPSATFTANRANLPSFSTLGAGLAKNSVDDDFPNGFAGEESEFVQEAPPLAAS